MSDNSLKESGGFGFWLGVGTAVISGAAAIFAADKAINKLGFEETGIRKDSFASGFQSRNYGGEVPKDGFFSGLQSAGATGLSTGQLVGAGLVVGAATYGVTKLLSEASTPPKKKE